MVRYELKTPYRDGTTHVIFEPLDFMAKLAALEPKPRVNLTRYHGVFAPNSKHRINVTPAKRGKGSAKKLKAKNKKNAELLISGIFFCYCVDDISPTYSRYRGASQRKYVRRSWRKRLSLPHYEIIILSSEPIRDTCRGIVNLHSGASGANFRNVGSLKAIAKVSGRHDICKGTFRHVLPSLVQYNIAWTVNH